MPTVNSPKLITNRDLAGYVQYATSHDDKKLAAFQCKDLIKDRR
jgi:hypothetical protein